MKDKVKVYISNLKKCENLPEWIAVLAVLLFSMFTMFYSDFQGTMDFAYQVTREIMHGNVNAIANLAANSYGMTMAIVLIIWMIPFCIFTLPFGKEFWYFGSIAGAIWSKLFLLVMTVFLLKAMEKLAILLNIKKENRKWISLFLLTSVFYFLPVVEIGQCDIIALTFMMWGIVFYIKGDLKKFLAFFAFAIPMKYFPLMVFVPLVLLHEKNPLKIILQGICGGSLLGINLIIRKFVWGSVVGSFTSDAIGKISSTSNSIAELEEVSQNATVYIESNAIEAFFGPFISNASLFVMCYILICIFAYALKYDSNKCIWSVYIPFLVFCGFFTLTEANVYWIVLMLPYMVLVIFSNASQLRLNMLLETIAGWAMLFIYMFKMPWVVGGESTFEYIFLKGNTVGSNMETYFRHVVDLTGLLPYAYSAYIACMIGIILVNIPMFKKENEGIIENQSFDRWIIWSRIGLVLVWVLLLVYVLLMRR